ncbi:hypothetical protein CGSMWGv6420B_02411 [Gardnerella vaginalis 6420B]|nr:hypothetical protein CGSMWGv6420B_02411 [Gardnerella vaginalis 6420B]
MSVTTQSVSTDSAPKKRNLTIIESAYVAVMLFGMFFGAGNLIFPVSLELMQETIPLLQH